MSAKRRTVKKDAVSVLCEGILSKDRTVLAKAITLVESNREQDRRLSHKLLEEIIPASGKSVRIGITGAPGVGKSTFIEAFGKELTSIGKRVAVLAIDPSSTRSKGSILGDKTRMDELSKDPNAFVRPSPAGDTAGGVAGGTRDAILLCEAAGYDIILVETVGVGQSDVSVRSMVDFFLLLMMPGSGDELQGIKKGIMEMADGLAITKSDGDNMKRASQAQADFQHALHLFQASESGWSPKVIVTSALTRTGMRDVWKMIGDFLNHVSANGFLESQRKQQQLSWFRTLIDNNIRNKFLGRTKRDLASLEKRILAGKITPAAAAHDLLTKLKI